MKDKDRLKHKGYATIMTNFGGLNLELHADRAPKTVYNFIMLAKEGKYDDVNFHRLIPGFMVRLLSANDDLIGRSKVETQRGADLEASRTGESHSGMNTRKRAR